jgi:hypothetical protein
MLEYAFKTVSMIFALSAIATGAQALVDPVGFAKSFGIPVRAAADKRQAQERVGRGGGERDAKKAGSSKLQLVERQDEAATTTAAQSYVSLMGVRQLATGVTLITFAYQDKWSEMATILCILGFLVAGTDGLFLSRSGAVSLGCFHAVPGALIALLSGAFILM